MEGDLSLSNLNLERIKMKYGEEFYTDQSGYSYYRYGLCRHLVKCLFRAGPIPGNDGRRWRAKYSCLRHMKTTQERRWSQADKQYTRASRNKANLPNHWDDRDRADIGDKSWKRRKKKKQWM